MEFLQGEAFDDLFRRFRRSAFHLELQDSYHTPEEAGPFQLFLDGQPDDFAWHQPWLRLVRKATSEGRRISRVRVVTVPHGEYTRWGLTVAPLNIEAGEEIRWLPREGTRGMDLPVDDFWLLDDDLVVFTIFEPGGRFAGGAATTDHHILQRCTAARDQVWAKAIPHTDYVAGKYTSA